MYAFTYVYMFVCRFAYVADSMERSTWEAKSSSEGEQSLHYLPELNIHYCVLKVRRSIPSWATLIQPKPSQNPMSLTPVLIILQYMQSRTDYSRGPSLQV